MCGITGIISDTNIDAVKRMTQALSHRGPDGEGFFFGPGIALGHRRLSIIDIAGGKQPIASSDGQLQLVCNGEIYNSPAIRNRYETEGYAFRTKTDVEVILPLYMQYGPDCVKHLRGMFAFAIWDSRNNSVFMARDHLGQKPLFYARSGRDILFASEVKSILAAGLLQPEPDLEALWHYIALRFVPDDHSLVRNIKKLRAGHYLIVKDKEIVAEERYWSPRFEPKYQASELDLTDELDELLNETVKLHLLSDVEVGVFLSGGIDSSTVAAIAANHLNTPMTSFSIGVKDQSFNELPYSRMAAEHCGLNAREQVVEADLVRMMPAMIHAMDEPSDPFGVGLHLVSNLASQHVKVVLSGDGGDESFAGYDRYSGQKIVDYYCLLPRSIRKHVMSRLVNLVPETFGYKSLALKAKWLNEMSFYSHGDRYAHSMSFLRFTEEARQNLFTKEARSKLGELHSDDKILEFFDSDNAKDLVDRMLYTDLMTRIPDHLLTLGDRMSMAFSLEMRPVLVDYKLVEFAARLPANLKLRGRELKYLLKRVASRYLPSELIDRPKQGFSFPIGRWIRTDLKEYTKRLFQQSRFVELGLFEREYIDGLLNDHLRGAADHNYRLWILINLEMWYRLYFENQTVEDLQGFTEELLAA
jgi:asparagine synthase (glutamine-hydrolysing)